MTLRFLSFSLLVLAGCSTPPAEPAAAAPSAAEAPAAVDAAPAVADAAPSTRGAEVFATNCAICHGAEGRGDGPGGVSLDPPAADLRGMRAAHLKGIPRRQIIEEGRPGTAMVGWKAILSPEDLDAVYTFVHEMKHGPGGGMGGMGANVDKPTLQRAQGAMMALGSSLKGELVSTMKEQGPEAALEVCSTSAQAMTAEVATEQGVTLGRSSLRLRNPANAGPAWVQGWLTMQGERKAEGVKPQVLSATRDDGVAVVRVIKPLPVEAPCLVCHGPDEGRAPSLSETLAQRYPSDAATGYALGDLRGAIWAEAVVK